MTEAASKRVRVVISGYVQGVGFRATCQREALRAGVTGWVRNRWDGSVEALFEGPPAAVDQMVRWCWRGPSRSHVESVEVSEEPPAPPQATFFVR